MFAGPQHGIEQRLRLRLPRRPDRLEIVRGIELPQQRAVQLLAGNDEPRRAFDAAPDEAVVAGRGARRRCRVRRLQRGGKQRSRATPGHFGAGACRREQTGGGKRRDAATGPAAPTETAISGDLGGYEHNRLVGTAAGWKRAPPSPGSRVEPHGAGERPHNRCAPSIYTRLVSITLITARLDRPYGVSSTGATRADPRL